MFHTSTYYINNNDNNNNNNKLNLRAESVATSSATEPTQSTRRKVDKTREGRSLDKNEKQK
jgi:hypothetical protein